MMDVKDVHFADLLTDLERLAKKYRPDLSPEVRTAWAQAAATLLVGGVNRDNVAR